MNIKLIVLLFLPVFAFSQDKDIRLIDVVFKDSINYYSFYHDKSLNHDEVTTSKNISLITETANFDRFIKCKYEEDFKIYDDDIIISNDMLYPYDVVRRYSINTSIRNRLLNYFEKNKLESRKIKRKRKYTLFRVIQSNIIILVFETTIEYFNTISNNLKLKSDNSKVKVYKILNGSDEDLIHEWLEK